MTPNLITATAPIAFAAPATRPASPLMLADRLITLAQEADLAGFRAMASDLINLAFQTLEHPAH